MQGPRLPESLGLLLCCACGAQPTPSSPRAEACPPVSLSIVATNDIHGQLERLPIVAGFVDNLRRARPDTGVLLVDAGDAFQGTLESNLDEGAAVIAAYRVMGYSAFALGNHEFDFGPEGRATHPEKPGDDPRGALKRRIAEAPFAMLSANLVDANGRRPAWPHLRPSAEVTVRGVHIGLVGLLTEEAADTIKKPNFDGLRTTPLAPAAEREARALRDAGADIVVVVAHEGGECTRFDDPKDLSSCQADSAIFRFARAMPKGLIDVIVGGHRNAAVAHVVAGIPVVHAPSNLVAFSRVDLSFDPVTRRVIDSRIAAPHPVCTVPLEQGCKPGNYEGRPVVADPAVLAAVEPALAAARALRNEPVGVTVEAAFPVAKHAETALGNLFADIMREAVPGSDVAIGNAGSIRDVLPQGHLTFGQLHHVMPFDNELARIELKGKDLTRVLQGALTDELRGEPAISGLRLRGECAGSTLHVTLLHPDGSAIGDGERLTVATNDFLALGGDGLFTRIALPASSVTLDTGTSVRDALIAGLKKRGSIRPTDKSLFDPEKPRIALPAPPPVHCPLTEKRTSAIHGEPTSRSRGGAATGLLRRDPRAPRTEDRLGRPGGRAADTLGI